jgi:dTDP-4-dehydrorhamnose reductase
VLGVPLLHLSTDYVFDGRKPSAYNEDDPTGPAGVYGRTKLAGEQAVFAAHDNVAVLRTAWVYSPFGRNFCKTMLALAKDRSEVPVVADQVGNQTSALDIADALLAVGRHLAESEDKSLRGLFHLAASDEASWADFAEHIFASSAKLGGPSAAVVRIGTEEFPTRARRPANSRLDCSRIAKRHGFSLPAWRNSATSVVAELLGNSTETKVPA